MQSTSTSATRKKATELGCALDVDLDTGKSSKGGGQATDDTALLNAFLATASETNPLVLEMDGAALVTGVKIADAGYTTIVGNGDSTGFYLKTGSNSDGIFNRAMNSREIPGTAAPERSSKHIELRNFRINGNRGNGHTGNSNGGNFRGAAAWLAGIYLLSVDQVYLEEITVFNASTYSIVLSNASNVVVNRCRLIPFGPNDTVVATNTDGIHVNGPSSDIEIKGCFFRTGDDGIALNAPEGYAGTIERITATNCTFDHSQLLMRMYAGSRSKIMVRDVTVSGFSGTTNVMCFLFGQDDRSVLTEKDAIQNVLIHNCQVTGAYLACIQDNVADLTIRDVVWTPTDIEAGMVVTANHALSVGSLTLNKCTMHRTKSGHGPVCVVDLREKTYGDYTTQMGTLTVDGLACTDEEGNSFGDLEAFLLQSPGSRVETIDIKAVDGRKIKMLTPESEWSQIGSVSGAGLLSAGWPVPDAKAKDGTRYLSEESNMPSVKKKGLPHSLATSTK